MLVEFKEFCDYNREKCSGIFALFFFIKIGKKSVWLYSMVFASNNFCNATKKSNFTCQKNTTYKVLFLDIDSSFFLYIRSITDPFSAKTVDYTDHTVILTDWTLKNGVSLGTQSKNNFWNPVRDSWGPH